MLCDMLYVIGYIEWFIIVIVLLYTIRGVYCEYKGVNKDKTNHPW
jgi:hypothetical protein